MCKYTLNICNGAIGFDSGVNFIHLMKEENGRTDVTL